MASARGIRTALVVAVTVAATAASSGVPAAASYYESGVSLSTTIIRDSVPYRLNVKAIEAMGGTSRMDVTISRLEDPSGLARLRQTQEWTFPLQEGEFVAGSDSYGIDAGDDAGPFRVKLDIERRDDACSKDQQLFVSVPDDGAFRIETDNATFATISEVPKCAKSYWFSDGPRPGPPPCPVEGTELQSTALDLKHRRSADALRIRIYATRERTISGEAVRWIFALRGVVGARRFHLNRDLTGLLDGRGAPWLDGRAEIESRGARERVDWYRCRGGREARSVRRSVAITGDLTVDVTGYESFIVQDEDEFAAAIRSWVRPRS